MLYRYNESSPGSSRITTRALIGISIFLCVNLLVAGCSNLNLPPSTKSSPPPTDLQGLSFSATSTSQPTDTAQPQPTDTPTQVPVSLGLAPYLPDQLHAALLLPGGYTMAQSPADAQISLEVTPADSPSAIQWVYALVAPFPTITDGVTADVLRGAWGGNPVDAFNGTPLLMDESTLGVLTAYWGPPVPQAVLVRPADELLDYAWSNRPSWAIIPFEKLDPRWKVLTIDDQSPVRKEFDPTRYPLTIRFGFSGEASIQPAAFNLPATNRDSTRLTTVVMTGVTALVRATAYTMEAEGITYPAEDIGSILADADITHISNEIPFTPDCPFPTPSMDRLVFCSSPRYIDLLKSVGTDIIELTGDHFMDYGADATLYTLQMYKDLGWKYYGGGANAQEARQPVLLENNGNKLAFLGCNIGCQVKTEIPCNAIATQDHPGAAECDFNWLSTEIPTLRDEGYQVIFTFQHREYYTYTTEPILATDFGQIAADGAAIVSGSQAHQPHGFAFEDGAFIHYGLGNLFFDQFHYCDYYACDDAFIDRHVFYAGKYISTELIPIRFVDFARPRLMTPEERAHFLELIFKAGGW